MSNENSLINNTETSNVTISNIPENIEKRWELVNKIEEGLNNLLETYNNNTKLKAYKKKLEKMKNLKEQLSKQEQDLKLANIVTLRERNVYLEKLRNIEEIGDEKDWEDEEGFLQVIQDLLYKD
jgi:cell shape-determining protein MreC